MPSCAPSETILGSTSSARMRERTEAKPRARRSSVLKSARPRAYMSKRLPALRPCFGLDDDGVAASHGCDGPPRHDSPTAAADHDESVHAPSFDWAGLGDEWPLLAQVAIQAAGVEPLHHHRSLESAHFSAR